MTVVPVLVRGRARGLLAFAILTVSFATSSCAMSRVMCDYAPFADTIFGTLVARDGTTATFTVTTVTPVLSPPGSRSKPPAIVKGQRLAVHYPINQIRFLHVGRRYQVAVWWLSNRFESGVHVSSDNCSTGTKHADGSAIDTSPWSRARRALVVGGAVVILVFVSVTTAASLRSRRRRRR